MHKETYERNTFGKDPATHPFFHPSPRASPDIKH